jgi:carboxypeptidase family protein
MPRHSRWFSIPCLFCAIIAAEDCRSTSTPRAPAESPYTIVYRSAAPVEVDSTRRFQTKVSIDSTLSSGEIAGTVVSASTGAPAPMVTVWIDYPAHRHTERQVFTDAEGNFRIRGLPDERGILHASGLGFHPDSVPINPQTKSFVRFALPVTLVRLMY